MNLGRNGCGIEQSFAGDLVDTDGAGALAAHEVKRQPETCAIGPADLENLCVAMRAKLAGGGDQSFPLCLIWSQYSSNLKFGLLSESWQ